MNEFWMTPSLVNLFYGPFLRTHTSKSPEKCSLQKVINFHFLAIKLKALKHSFALRYDISSVWGDTMFCENVFAWEIWILINIYVDMRHCRCGLHIRNRISWLAYNFVAGMFAIWKVLIARFQVMKRRKVINSAQRLLRKLKNFPLF